MKRGAEMKISKLPPMKVYLFTLKMDEFIIEMMEVSKLLMIDTPHFALVKFKSPCTK